MKFDDMQRQQIKEAEVLAVGEACKAIFWPIPRLLKKESLIVIAQAEVLAVGEACKAIFWPKPMC